MDDRLICPAACHGEPIIGEIQGGMPLWSQAGGREGEAGSPDEVRATFGRGKSVPPPS